jgi:hypothetical protein
MPQQRIKGQEVAMSILQDGQLLTRIETISSSTIEFELDQLEEGYLGEVSMRYDSIFNGVSVALKGHMTNMQAIDLAQAIVARAQRRSGGAVRIDVVGSFAFPNGDFPTICISDVYFESVPFEIGGRDEYLEFSLSGKASEFSVI